VPLLALACHPHKHGQQRHPASDKAWNAGGMERRSRRKSPPRAAQHHSSPRSSFEDLAFDLEKARQGVSLERNPR
jgi:hypothetical protein